MKKIALFDFDNVIYKGHSVFDIIQSQVKDGLIDRQVWTVVEEELSKYRNEEIAYKDAADIMLETWARGLSGKVYKDCVNYC